MYINQLVKSSIFAWKMRNDIIYDKKNWTNFRKETFQIAFPDISRNLGKKKKRRERLFPNLVHVSRATPQGTLAGAISSKCCERAVFVYFENEGQIADSVAS